MKSSSPIQKVQLGAAASFGFALFALWLAGGPSFQRLQLSEVASLDRPDVNLIWPILALISVIFVNSLFAGAETAVELLRPLHVKHLRDKNPKKGDRLQTLLENRLSYIATCRLGSYTSILSIVVLSFLIAPSFAERVNWTDYGRTLAMSILIMIPVGVINLVLELVPKSYATLHPHGVASALYSFILGASYIFWIPEKMVTGFASIVTSRFGGKASFALANQAEEEIKTLVETAEETGEMESDERELLHSVFEFSDTIAREVMTPRVDIDAMSASSDPNEVLTVIKASGHSRIPIYEDTDDQIIGIVHAKDLFMAMLEDGCPDLKSLMRVPLFVPENKNLHELLTEMRTNRSQMAIVQDEFGGTAGIVTIEDIVEELVGDIVDEYDDEQPDIIQVEGEWLIAGRTHLDDVNAAVGSEFESEEFDTVGGFVFGLFGRQPSQEEFIDAGDFRFIVAETDGRRIGRLKIAPIAIDFETVMEEEQV